MQILIAQHDAPLASFLRQGLVAEHYQVDVCHDGLQAWEQARQINYDVIVLGLDLPLRDGFSLLQQVRMARPAVPILVLTARSRIEDRVKCFDAGADDYLTKPFSFAELSARIRALIRRSHVPSEAVLTVGDLKLDRVGRRVERAGKRIELTGKEFELLDYLMRNAGRCVTRAMIIENVWKMAFPAGTTNVVDVYINLLRKISADFAYQKPRWTADSRRQLRQRLLRCPFQVELAVPSLRVALGELAHLEPGSILVLPQAASSAATFSIVNQQAFAANPARRGNIRVAQLLHRLPTSEKEERP